MTRKNFDGREYSVYTMQDWEEHGTLAVAVGEVIEPDVFWQLLNSVPPKRYGGGVFQVGEPDSWDFDHCCNLYQTFERIEGDYWKYVGLKN